MAFGYAYPAYECYKVVEMNKPKLEQLLFWCQYWILVAGITVCERFGDNLVSWLPLYNETKLALFIYLWHPKTRGTTYIYKSFFQPFVAKHEAEIDRCISELKVNSKDAALRYTVMAMGYGQRRFIEILQFVSSQASLLPREDHKRQVEPNARTTDKIPTSDATCSTPEDKQSEKPEFPLPKTASWEQPEDENPSPNVASMRKRSSDTCLEKAATPGKATHRRGKWNMFQSA